MKQLTAIILIVAALLGGGLRLALNTTETVADISRSVAEIEEAQAFQEAAAANHDAIRALGTVTVLDRVLLILLILLAVAVVGALCFVYSQNQRLKQAQMALAAAQQRPRWAPGPNAGWKRLNEAAQPSAPSTQDLINLAMMSMAASLARSLGSLPQAGPQQTQPAARLPAAHLPAASIAPAQSMLVLDEGDLPQAKLLDVDSDWDLFTR